MLQSKETYVYDRYAGPSKTHWLGTDTNGMDMLTRLMYGGRVSLVIGFIVVFIEAFLGILLGGIAGYFGKWVDNLIMRIVDIFYCIPSTPLIIILGAAMDAMQLDPQIRMLYLMLVLGFLGWPSIARLVRGQILSLREQGIYDSRGSLRYPRFQADFPSPGSERYPAADRNLYDEPWRYDHYGSNSFLLRSGC